ncbi:MAG: hypothetical protein CMK07_12255 [Ponticaulis sp.]|nr:hypothetical protein [Ponticaulis sp.]
MSGDISLAADCSACAALCCIAFAFTEGEEFAVDKPANEPCSNLRDKGRCAIYETRAESGYPGCLKFDCQGAGQRVVQQLFDGQSWQDDAKLVEPMSAAMRAMLVVHQQLQLLRTAAALPLTPVEQSRLDELLSVLEPEPEFTPETLADLDLKSVRSGVSEFLKGLRHHFAR